MGDYPWIGEPDPEGSGIQQHEVYRGSEHPCCGCQACDEIYKLRDLIRDFSESQN